MSSTDAYTPGALKPSNTLSSLTDSRALILSCEGVLMNEQKASSLSQSSSEGNSVTASLRREDVDYEVNPLKRRGVDTTSDYPRRRAIIACEICRSRKSRCDGSKPKCRLCIELGAECNYREPGIKLDAGSKLILEHLTRIEDLLRSNFANQTKHPAPVSGSPSRTATANNELNAHNHVNFASMAPIAGLRTWTSPTTSISTMPKEHSNAAPNLLQWPLIKDLVSQPYDPQVLLQLEMSREPLALLEPQCVDLSNNTTYIQAFFSRVNIWYACVNPYNWQGYYRKAVSNRFREGPESCIVLLVLALGQASICGSISRISLSSNPPGLSYFSSAWSLLPNLMIRNTVLSTQCMVLAAAYLFYLVRPVEAWNILSSTSTKLHLLLSGSGRIPAGERELSERVYWNTLLFESDLLTEFNLPHSGIVQFEESVGLPGEFPEYEQYAETESDGIEESNSPFVGRDELWYFLAEISLRRLLIRACQLIYGKGDGATMGALEPVVAELDFQLGQWYESLPLPLQFPYTRGLLADPIQSVLRLRFFACKTTIFRPYVLTVMDNEQASLDQVVMENCRKCLDAAIRQLDYITAHHVGHMPYLWQGALSVVSQTLLVMGATMSPSLAPLLPPPQDMDVIIKGVVDEIARYSHLAPSLSLSAEIIKEAECKRKDILRNL